MTRIFHIATASDWDAAQATGRYTTSTRGRTLAEEGFLHASRGDQWEGVRQRFYADVTEPLVLLVIDTDLVGVPVVEESVLDSAETFPHIYGALDPAAVVQVLPLNAGDDQSVGLPATAPTVTPPPTPPTEPLEPAEPSESFSALFFREMFFNLALATIVLASVAVAALVGLNVDEEWGALAGTVVGFGVGLPVAIAMNRRRNSASD
ncbi:hypothetical protein GCM10027020_19730 [Nocardioides salsibiostraticola]